MKFFYVTISSREVYLKLEQFFEGQLSANGSRQATVMATEEEKHRTVKTFGYLFIGQCSLRQAHTKLAHVCIYMYRHITCTCYNTCNSTLSSTRHMYSNICHVHNTMGINFSLGDCKTSQIYKKYTCTCRFCVTIVYSRSVGRTTCVDNFRILYAMNMIQTPLNSSHCSASSHNYTV